MAFRVQIPRSAEPFPFEIVTPKGFTVRGTAIATMPRDGLRISIEQPARYISNVTDVPSISVDGEMSKSFKFDIAPEIAPESEPAVRVRREVNAESVSDDFASLSDQERKSAAREMLGLLLDA